YRASAERDPGRPVSDLDRLNHDLLVRIDPRDTVRVHVRHPERARPGGYRARRRADRDLTARATLAGPEDPDRVSRDPGDRQAGTSTHKKHDGRADGCRGRERSDQE